MNFRSDTLDDSGASLLEVLLAASLIGLISTALATTATSISTSSGVVAHQLDITRDIERIQAIMSLDLTRYGSVDDSPGAMGNLPGSNVVTLSEPATNSQPGVPAIVSYRYFMSAGTGHLMRYALDDVSSPSTNATLSSHLPPPPTGWTPGNSVAHAATYAWIETNGAVDRVVDIVFANGERTRVIGHRSGLAQPSTDTTQVPARSLTTPRCGGSVTIVLNTSSSTWSQGAASTITGDLLDFVHSMRGTPSHVRIVGFDRSAYSIYPENPIGSFIDMLNSSTLLTGLPNRLATLSSSSSNWRNGRNWEDGLWQATRRDIGTLYAQLPSLIVFITDGTPNRNRTNTSTDTDTTFHTADLTRAVTAADYARSTGATLVGILLGTGADTTARGHLASVFGSTTWEGSSNLLPANRARTFPRPTTEGFARLDEILGLIAQWRCSDTVTLQQRILSGTVSTPAIDPWTFSVTASNSADAVVATVDERRTSATVDLGLSDGVSGREITIVQAQRPGHRHHSATCTASGQPLATAARTAPDGTTTLSVVSPARTAVSCTLTSEVTS